MTDQTAGPQPTMDVKTATAMAQATLDALPQSPNASEEDKATRCSAAMIFIGALRPRDPMEAILAARIATSHFAAMEQFRCAAQPGLPSGLQLRYTGRAIQLCRLMDATSRAFTQRRSQPALRPMEQGPLPATAAQPAQPHAQPAQQAATKPSQPAASPPAARPQSPAAPALNQPAPKPAPTRRLETAAASPCPLLPAMPSSRPAFALLTMAEAARERMLDEIVARTRSPVSTRVA
jgi:hypothetical protein